MKFRLALQHRLHMLRHIFDAPKGRVEVSWKREADKIALFVTLPEGMSGTIRLPSGYYFEDGNVDRIAESGEYTILYK